MEKFLVVYFVGGIVRNLAEG